MTPVPVPAAGGNNAAGLVLTSLLPAAAMLAALPLAVLAAARLRRHLAPVADKTREFPLRAFLVGLLVALAVLLLASASGRSPVFGVPALLALAAAAAAAFLGLVAEARRLGCEVRGRDPSADGVEGASSAVGWLLLAGLPLLPVVGPLVLLYLALRAAGAGILALSADPAPAAA
jgi:hypothetical protein